MIFTRKIFGINVSLGQFEALIDNSLTKNNSYSCFLNSHMLFEHYKNPKFAHILKDADFVFPDGMPIIYSIRFFLKIGQIRIAGNDAIFSLVNKAKQDSLKIYCIGGQNHVLDKISFILSEMKLEHEVYSPPFIPIEQFDFIGQAERIKRFDPDMVLVGLGCPKQEIWMNRMKNLITAPMYGVGGAFLLFAGIDKRAPKLMRDVGMEWLFRLILEPRRLFKRYFITNTYFCFLFLREIFKKH